jgi:hypothetical protein
MTAYVGFNEIKILNIFLGLPTGFSVRVRASGKPIGQK